MDHRPEPGRSDIEAIRLVPLFAGFSDEEAAELWAGSKRLSSGAGELVIREGDFGDAMFIVLTGELEVTKRDGDREIVLAVRRAGEFIGEMSLLEQAPRTASVRATAPSELLEVDAATFRHLLESRPGTATTLLRTVAGRLRSTEALLVQSDKLASLGTLAAGLAHELNNPAAAIQRSGSLLQEAFDRWQSRTAALGGAEMSAAEQKTLARLEAEFVEARTSDESGTALQKEETLLIDWLDSRSIAEPWELASVLVAFGWGVDRVSPLAAEFAAPHLGPVVQWAAAALSVRQLLTEIQMSAKAISDIVHAVKSYAYLDQAPVQNVDLPGSLEDTLMILNHKLRHGVEVVRTFEADLPRIEAYAGELNQVWTNIIDNAAQAMAGDGRLEIAVRRRGDGVEIRIADSGPGILPNVLPHIFEPFFTTKAQGIGTGLGLHIAHNIVVARHRGRIDVESRPGRTEFRVLLPVRLKSDGKVWPPSSNERSDGPA